MMGLTDLIKNNIKNTFRKFSESHAWDYGLFFT